MTNLPPFLRDFRIDAVATNALQSAVCEKLIDQTQQVVLGYVKDTSDPSALAGLQALLDLPDDRRKRIILHPVFRYWLQAMRRTSRGEYAELRQKFASSIPDFVWSEQLVLGRSANVWRVSTDGRGGLRCPSLGRYLELGGAYADQLLEVSLGGESAIIRCPDGLTIQVPAQDLSGAPLEDPPTIEDHGYRLSISPFVADNRIEVTTRDPWLRVKLTGTNQRTDGTEFMGVDDELYPASPDFVEVTNALTLLKQYWPEAYEDFSVFTQVIVPIVAAANPMRPWQQAAEGQNDESRIHLAFTVSSRQGAIYIGDAPIDSSIEMLIHENAHVKLRQLQAIDTLLCDPLDESFKVSVPWRPDPRPLPGILEGLFVFTHVAEFDARRWRTAPHTISTERLTKRVQDLSYAVACLEQHARLTDGGVEFLAAMKRWVLDLQCCAPSR